MTGRQQFWWCSGSIDEKKSDAIMTTTPSPKGLGVKGNFREERSYENREDA